MEVRVEADLLETMVVKMGYTKEHKPWEFLLRLNSIDIYV